MELMSFIRPFFIVWWLFSFLVQTGGLARLPCLMYLTVIS